MCVCVCVCVCGHACQTCLYGLGITLRCAAGQKYSTAEQLDVAVGPAFQELMTTLLEDNPDLRPSLEVALMVGVLFFMCCFFFS